MKETKSTSGTASQRKRLLRDDAQEIFRAGVEAVRAETLIRENVQLDGRYLKIGKLVIDLRKYQRLFVIGAGKASGYMARAVLDVLGPELVEAKKVSGWVNVPEGGDVAALPGVTLFPARPSGENLPTQNVLIGTQRIMELVASMQRGDLCLCMVSGGGSALLAQPVEGVSLEDKRRVSQLLSQRRADIRQLNRVRRQLSLVKGGRLARLRPGGRLISLIISDVLGDPLDLIASGPTAPSPDDPADALAAFAELAIPHNEIPTSVLNYLQNAAANRAALLPSNGAFDEVQNIIVGDVSVAMQAAARHAQQLGFQLRTATQEDARETVNQAARWLHVQLRRAPDEPTCLIYGGEPVIDVGDRPGLGGRNQHLVLQVISLLREDQPEMDMLPSTFCLLSGGTDGEDGNTSVAGAWFDRALFEQTIQQGIDPGPYLGAYSAFRFFEQVEGLVNIGPTQTNVGDLRILLTQRDRSLT